MRYWRNALKVPNQLMIVGEARCGGESGDGCGFREGFHFTISPWSIVVGFLCRRIILRRMNKRHQRRNNRCPHKTVLSFPR